MGQETSERRKKPFQLARGIGKPPRRSNNATQQTTVLHDPAVSSAGSTVHPASRLDEFLTWNWKGRSARLVAEALPTRRRPWQEDRRYSGQTMCRRATHPAIPSRSGRDSASAIPGALEIMQD